MSGGGGDAGRVSGARDRGTDHVNTGEVVAGTEERLATGDAVNVAARLEQAADPGEVLIGAPTLALVREAVVVEVVEPLALKGKAEPLPAFRLLAGPGSSESTLTLRGSSVARGSWGRFATRGVGRCRRRDASW